MPATRVNHPAMCCQIRGRGDRIVPVALTEEMNRRIPASKLLTFDGGRLFTFLLSRKPLLDAVVGFPQARW